MSANTPPPLSALGVLFDWDGVIIDSSSQHEEGWERLSAETGKPLPADHFKRGFGMKNEHIIPNLLGWTSPDDHAEITRLARRKEEIYLEIVRERGVQALPGVAAFLHRLRDAGVPFAVGSSTQRPNIDTILGTLGFSGLFAGIVTAEDVRAGKPHPEVFLRAAEKISRAPERCVVFEDAFVGIEAARAGGMKVVAVATTNPASELQAVADRVVHRLDELTVAD
ncbi:MAG: HAD family phosphatase, partial [Opitutaceae bacterium]|nr:HAD family phosphatase [Opitutaceae bacterium]